MDINEVIYNFLSSRIKSPYELRYPYQSTPANLKNGYLSWAFITSQTLSTQSKKSIKDNDVYKQITAQRFIESYLFYCERESGNTNTPIDVLSSVHIYFNSEDFIKYAKDKNIEALRILDNITDDTYYSERKQWIKKATMQVNFITQREVTQESFKVDSATIDIQHI